MIMKNLADLFADAVSRCKGKPMQIALEGVQLPIMGAVHAHENSDGCFQIAVEAQMGVRVVQMQMTFHQSRVVWYSEGPQEPAPTSSLLT